jgi:hypothetical protein
MELGLGKTTGLEATTESSSPVLASTSWRPATDCGMYPTVSVSLECRSADDMLPVCWGGSGSSAEVLEAEYHSHGAKGGVMHPQL